MGHSFPKTWAKSSVITSPSSRRFEDGSHIVSLPNSSSWQERKNHRRLVITLSVNIRKSVCFSRVPFWVHFSSTLSIVL